MDDSSIIYPLKLFDLARSQDRLLYASAPMVRYSKLAFRQTVYSYGTDLCWTPMIIAKEFNRSHFARDSDFTIATNGPQPPTIVQFGANSPLELARASSLVAPYASGVDLNCGCPQSWACAETLGAALMDRRELVRDMVLETRQRLHRDGWAVGDGDTHGHPGRGRSVSVKIRVHKDLRKTMDFLHTVVGPEGSRHIDFVTIHPRTRQTPSSAPIDLDALDVLTSTFGDRLPVLLSGDVFSLDALPFVPVLPSGRPALLPGDDDDDKNRNNSGPSPHGPPAPRPAITKLSGLMAARALLANPALFAGRPACPWEAVERFLGHAARCPLPLPLTLHHLSEMCGPGAGPAKAVPLLPRRDRLEMLACANMCDLVDLLDRKRGPGGFRRVPARG